MVHRYLILSLAFCSLSTHARFSQEDDMHRVELLLEANSITLPEGVHLTLSTHALAHDETPQKEPVKKTVVKKEVTSPQTITEEQPLSLEEFPENFDAQMPTQEEIDAALQDPDFHKMLASLEEVFAFADESEDGVPFDFLDETTPQSQ